MDAVRFSPHKVLLLELRKGFPLPSTVVVFIFTLPSLFPGKEQEHWAGWNRKAKCGGLNMLGS